jgi:glycosyltransferase involved in cell wall biosynthesis
MSSLEQWELLGSASCLVAPLHPGVVYSLEVVEAMAYGTPVVTMVGTVGAELVSHGVSGLVLSDRVLLPGAISKAERLDPRRVRAHAASRFDLRGMVSAYEWLLTQFAAIPGADGGGGLAATPSDAPAGSAPVPIVRGG